MCFSTRYTVALTGYRAEAEITQHNAMTCIMHVRLDDLIVPSGLKSYELWI